MRRPRKEGSASWAEPCRRTERTLRAGDESVGFLGFIVYTTWAAFQNAHFHPESLLSPFYSPLLFGIGYCNITKCCTRVCPEDITITDNAIIPLKERVVDRFYDPVMRVFRMFGSGK